MKAILGCESKGMLGEFIYTHVFKRGLGHAVIWDNAPPAGTQAMNGKDRVTVDEVSLAGMLAVTRQSDSVQVLVFPWDLKLSN